MTVCEKCGKHEEYHSCSECNQHLCIDCFNTVHFGINAPRSSSSIVYNKCVFCGEIYGSNVKVQVCDKCTIILTWISSMNYLAAVNRVSQLIRTNRLDSKLKNENYCKANFGAHATQVIMDAVDSLRIR
jgi:ubiquitin